MIELTEVTKHYAPGPRRVGRDAMALQGVTLSIPAGGVWAIVGPNGAGKTTLFGLLLGFLHPTEGRVRIEGEAPRRYIRRRGAAYLPERFRLDPDWTVGHALRALARLEGLERRTADARADALLERFELAPHAAKPIGALSRGLLQRLGLAQALIAERELVVLDEPAEGLDPLWRVRFRDLVDELRAAGRTVLVASHDLAEVERLADRVVVLEGGRVRELFQVARSAGGPTSWRLELAAPAPAVADAFPGATPASAMPTATSTGRPDSAAAVYIVEAADAADLSRRLAALLSAGATLVSVTPGVEPLEDRVRRALLQEGDA